MNQIHKLDVPKIDIARPADAPETLLTLIVDDNQIDRRRLKAMCDKATLGLEFVETTSIAEMKAALNETVFDLIFIDYRLGDGDGLGALNLIKKHALNHNTATIMVAGVDQTSVAVSALKSGCNDYVLKDALDPHWLKRAVTNAVDKSRLQRKIDSSEEMRSALTKALQEFSSDCTVEMKPLLSQMLRRVRNLRKSQPGADVDGIVRTCEQLWNFVEGLERAAVELCDQQWSEE